ncbi:MAG: beta-Ala-His dipeptidase [Bacteriovoracaceae bacterium]
MKPQYFPETPTQVWNFFHAITQVPRPSKHEEKIRRYIVGEAERLQLEYKVDNVGNVIIYVPASAGYESHAPVIIQNHMDMVTDATPDRKINFNEDPIITIVEGEWLTADRTTLGADNGIGCAAALALMEDRTLKHPPLEILFTVDEETGLVGAWGVVGENFKGRKLINLDTEEWGSLYIGCAGGIDYDFEKKYQLQSAKMSKGAKLTVGGFIGGHSGVDIHEQRGNALKFLFEIIKEAGVSELELAEVRGGKAHNIIPRDAFAYLNTNNLEKLKLASEVVQARWKSFQPKKDQSFFYNIEEADVYPEVLAEASAKEMMNFVLAFPHGAHKYDLEGEKLVALSDNMAIILFVRGQFYLRSSLRFFDRGECVGLENQIQALGDAFGMDYKKNGEYPSWKPVRENSLLDLVSSEYEKIFGSKPEVKAIHAGLECGILRDKIGPIEAVSMGPTITGAHSPDERVHIPSVEKFWTLLTATLASL